MHHDSEKSQATHSSVTALGLLKKKEDEDEWNVWAAIFITLTFNVIPKKLKAAVSVDTPVQHF